MSPSKEKFTETLLVGAIVVATIVRIAGCFWENPLDHLGGDPIRHWWNGIRFFSPSPFGAGDPILYQFYIFILHGIVGKNRYWIALACGLLSALMPYTYYRAAKELNLSKNAALAVWALIAWMPSLDRVYHYLMMETLLLVLVGLAFWMSARHLRKGTTRSFLAAVLCWTLACLTKSVAVPLATVAVGYLWWMKSRRLAPFLLGTGLVILMFIPSSVRTSYYLNWIAPLGNPWIAKIHHRSGARMIEIHYTDRRKVQFGTPSTFIQPLEPLSPWMIRRSYEDSLVKVRVDTSHGQGDWVKCYRDLNCTWREWMRQWGENILLFLFSPSWPECNVETWEGWLAYMSRWLIAPLVFVVFECNFREFRQRRFAFVPITATVFTLFLMFQNMAIMEGRFRKPLEPLLLLNLVWAYAKQFKNHSE